MPKSLFITQTINYLALYLFFRLWSDSTWYQNKEKEIIFIAVTYTISLAVGWFAWLFRPIKIQITQSNTIGSGETQTIILHSGGREKTTQEMRTIKLTINILRRTSIWWWLLIHYLNKKKLCLEVSTVPSGLEIQVNDRFQLSEIERTQEGFKIKLNPLLHSLNKQIGTFEISQTYLYSVTEHEELQIPSNLSVSINPFLSVDSKPIKLLYLLVNFKTDLHEIKYYKK
ncbi:hypothetical protein MOE20_06525 [Bacillus atrophaeus]|uniref:hypothetical protein n=1 Tax=Bacillus atrophaeus TaxID=1452 RepID=UPI0022812FEE|nr:hypothetical protein [Bacillus atrophaeus]MCY8915672.1 hypothetical protein [Bacillus atrophaeus]MCY8924287.1 hypothetical protein [Bacillus atrophaeus]